MKFINKYFIASLLFSSVLYAKEEVKKVFQPSENLKQIVGLTGSYELAPRVKRVHKLSKILSENEINYLWDFLNKKHSDDPLDQKSLNLIKNDVAVVLLNQSSTLEEYGVKMIEMFSTKDINGTFRHDNVWRDYCIHFLGHWVGDSLDETEREKAIDFLYESIDSNKGTSIPESALITINLSKVGLVQKLRLLRKAIEVASEPEYGELARMSAFHIAAEHSTRFRSDRPKVIKVLKSCINGNCSVCLKTSAIVALGTAGFVDDEVEDIISKHCKSFDIRLRKAAYGAKKKLKL